MKEELHTRSVWHRFTASFMAMLMLLSILTTMPVMAANVTSITFNNKTSAQICLGSGYTDISGSGTVNCGGKDYNLSSSKLTPISSDNFGNVFSFELHVFGTDSIAIQILDGDKAVSDPISPNYSYTGFDYVASVTIPFIGMSLESQDITIEFVKITKKYNVKITTSGEGFKVEDGHEGTNTVDEGENFEFTVSVDPGQVVTAKKRVDGKADTVINSNSEVVKTDDEWKYSFNVEEVKENMEIILSQSSAKYTVTVEGLDGEGFTTSLDNAKTAEGKYTLKNVTYNSPFSFSLAPKEGYERPEVKVGEDTINPVGDLYTILHVTDNITIIIGKPASKEYEVTFATKGTGFTAKASVEASEDADGTIIVGHGKDLTYTVTVDSAYSQSTPTVTANGKTYTLEHSDGNVYTFTIPITGETNITVSGLTLNKYTVTYNGNSSTDEYSTNLTKSKTVTHGDSIDFTVTPKTGYVAPKVTVNEEGKATLTSSENTYTLSNITGDVEVVITAGGKTEHTVTLPSKTDSYTLEVKNGEADVQTGTKVNYGDKITIKVTLNDDYSKSNPTVSVNGVPLNGTKDGKVYTCDEYTVNSNISISVSGVTKNTYTVAIPHGGEGYSVTANGGNTVTHGGSLSFTVAIDDGYQYTGSENYRELLTNIISGADVQVTLNGTRFTVTLNSITADIDSIVINEQNIKPIEYKVELKGDGVNYDIDANNVSKLPYNNSGFTFTVTPATGYKIDSVKYSTGSVEGADLAPSSGSTPSKSSYTVPAVSADVTVTVTVKPIDVNVTYTWDDIDIGGGALIPGGSNTVTYKNEGTHFWNVNGEKVEIKLPDETKYEGFTCTWSGECDSDCITIDAEDSHTDLDITVTGTFTVKAPETPKHEDEGSNEDAQGGIPFVDASVNTNAEGGYDVVGERIYYRWSSTLSLLADGDIKDALLKEDYNIEACGFLLSASGSLSYDIETLKTLSANGFIGDGRNTYAYYNQTIGKLDLTTYNTYNQSIYFEINDYDDVVTRTGAFWYRLTIGGKTYVYVTNSITITCDFNEEKKKLQDEDPEDDEELSPESEDEEVMNDAGEEEVPSAEA